MLKHRKHKINHSRQLPIRISYLLKNTDFVLEYDNYFDINTFWQFGGVYMHLIGNFNIPI